MANRLQSPWRTSHSGMTVARGISTTFPPLATSFSAAGKCGFRRADSDLSNTERGIGRPAMNPKLYATLLWFAFWGAITVGIWSLTK